MNEEIEERGALVVMGDIPLIDCMAAAIVTKYMDPDWAATAPFSDVVVALATAAQRYPEWVKASAEVRKYYSLCHFSCHLRRLERFAQQDFQWRPGQGPEDPSYLGIKPHGTLH